MDQDDAPKMIMVRWKLSIGFPGACREGEFEIEDDASKEAIDDMIRDEAMQHVDYWRIEKDEDED